MNFFHRITYDMATESRDIALAFVKTYCEEHYKTEGFTLFLEVYFESTQFRPNFCGNAKLLTVTFLILNYCDASFSDAALSKTLRKYPLNFSVEQLRLIRNRISSYEPPTDPSRSPLLLVYLMEDFDKFIFYLDCGHSLDVPYCDIEYTITSSDGFDKFSMVKYYKSKDEYQNFTLHQVVMLEHPELLRSVC